MSPQMIDVRSDTVTKPTPAMLEAMMGAAVGDDVYGEDETVNELQSRAAELFGMQAALYCPTGTMTNQIGVRVHTQPGDEVICHELAHIYVSEGCIASNSGASVRLLKGGNGRFTASDLHSGGELRLQRPERRAPPVGDALQRDVLRESVARDMPLRDRVPGPVFDRHARLLARRLEQNLDLRRLFGREARLAPGEDEAPAGLPSRDAADLEGIAVCEPRDEATANAGLERQLTVALRGDLKETVRLPPGGDLAGECFESAQRIGGYAQRNKHFRCHLPLFCRCALNAASWRAHMASVSASHAFSSAMACGLSR